MKIEPIADDELEAILAAPQTLAERFPVPEQHGPLRHFDTEMRCASRGCGSSTFLKVQGVQYCMTHSLSRLNEMLIERGVER
jgi:hypothetical protein